LASRQDSAFSNASSSRSSPSLSCTSTFCPSFSRDFGGSPETEVGDLMVVLSLTLLEISRFVVLYVLGGFTGGALGLESRVSTGVPNQVH